MISPSFDFTHPVNINSIDIVTSPYIFLQNLRKTDEINELLLRSVHLVEMIQRCKKKGLTYILYILQNKI